MPPPQLRAFANEPRKQLPELVQIIFERRRRSTTAFLIVLGARPVPVWPGEWGIKRDPFDDSSREEGVYWLSWSLAKSQPEAIVEMTNHLRARHAAPFSRGIRPQLDCTRKNLNLIREFANVRMLFAEKVSDGLFHYLAANLGDRFGQRNIFRADFDAVLRVPAFLNTAVSHQCGKPIVFQSLSSGMSIEQPDLRNRRCSHEPRILVELRTGLHTTAARDAPR